MNTRELDTLLERLETIAGLKDVARSGWVLRGIESPESVADHSWGTANLCLLLAPADIDRGRAIAIALVHDLAEVETGDIPRRVARNEQPVSPEEKEMREAAAIGRLARDDGLSGIAKLADVRSLWEEYAEGSSDEARFVRDMNLVDMCLQAVIYERARRYDPGKNRENFPDYECLDEFFATSRDRFATALGKDLFAALWSRYIALRDKPDSIPD